MSKLLTHIAEIIGWIKIFLSPLFISLAIAAFVYVYFPGTFGFILAVSIVVLGIIVGAILATYIWKKKGTIAFLSNEREVEK